MPPRLRHPLSWKSAGSALTVFSFACIWCSLCREKQREVLSIQDSLCPSRTCARDLEKGLVLSVCGEAGDSMWTVNGLFTT